MNQIQIKALATSATLSLREYGHACVEGQTTDVRFHIWLDASTLRPIDDVVYKNPVVRVRGMQTTRLNIQRGLGKQVAEAMLPRVPGLHANAKKALAQEIAAKQAVTDAARAEALAMKAGPQLLAAVKYAQRYWRERTDLDSAVLADAIAAATGAAS